MLIVELKDGPNKGKQIVFPTPDNKKSPDIETLPGHTSDCKDLSYFKDLMNESYIPKERFVAMPDQKSFSEPLWKKFLRLFRRSE